MRLIYPLLIALCLLTTSNFVRAQNWTAPTKINLEEQLTETKLLSLSLNSDTLIDVVVAGKAADGTLVLLTIENTGTEMVKRNRIATGFKNGKVTTTDINSDNRIDLVISGLTLIETPATFVFINTDNFSFQKQADKLLSSSGTMYFADLNNDTRIDIIESVKIDNVNKLRIYEKTSTGYTLLLDSTTIEISDIAVYDLDNNSTQDFVLSGINGTSPMMVAFRSQENFHFSRQSFLKPVSGTLFIQDMNGDGRADVWASGLTSSGSDSLRSWFSDEGFLPAHRGVSNGVKDIFSADLNHDGATDGLVLFNDDRLVSFNSLSQGFSPSPLFNQVKAFTTGDVDRDNDLDILILRDSLATTWLGVSNNNHSQKNVRPSPPPTGVAISIFEKTFVFWVFPTDDHTPVPSLTYDVWIGRPDLNTVTPTYDLRHKRRMEVSQGNAGHALMKKLSILVTAADSFAIQAIDNSYVGSYRICTGKCSPCATLAVNYLQACEGENVGFTAPPNSYWYSASSGFLGTGGGISVPATASDTLFSLSPDGSGCSRLSTWVVGVSPTGIKKEAETINACEGDPVTLSIPPGWTTVNWQTSPAVNNRNSITLTADKPQTILVTANNGVSGCGYEKTFEIKISKPEIEVENEVLQILKGTSVPLTITSTAQTFSWTPGNGLDNSRVQSPIASPLQTTTYTVTATDNNGCTATASIRVEVRATAFVPNLFTPNNDGRNDALLIYGLGNADNFKFTIYNREGAIVYQTTSVSEATGTGWNGTARGTEQPSGVYYWKVQGKDSQGGALLLNGKNNGSILLVR